MISYNNVKQANILGCLKTTLHNVVVPVLVKLSAVVDEIHWSDCLSPFNHTLDLPYLFTGMDDITSFILFIHLTQFVLHRDG
jgi:hypothetical protein